MRGRDSTETLERSRPAADTRRDSSSVISRTSTSGDGETGRDRDGRPDRPQRARYEGPRFGGPLPASLDRDSPLPIRPPPPHQDPPKNPARSHSAQRSTSPPSQSKGVYPTLPQTSADRKKAEWPPRAPAADRLSQPEVHGPRFAVVEPSGSRKGSRHRGPVDNGWPASRVRQAAEQSQRDLPPHLTDQRQREVSRPDVQPVASRVDAPTRGDERIRDIDRVASPVEPLPPSKRQKVDDADRERDKIRMAYARQRQAVSLPSDHKQKESPPLQRETVVVPSASERVPEPLPPPPSNADWSRRVILDAQRRRSRSPPPRARSPIRRRSPSPPKSRPSPVSQQDVRSPPRARSPPPRAISPVPPAGGMLTLPIRGPPGTVVDRDRKDEVQVKEAESSSVKVRNTAVPLRERIEGINDIRGTRAEVCRRRPVQAHCG
jgi:hypothetical protein